MILLIFFFFNDTATTEIYTLSLHDALPIYTNITRSGDGRGPRTARGADQIPREPSGGARCYGPSRGSWRHARNLDRKSTRLNSSHLGISYAVFCLKKKKK